MAPRITKNTNKITTLELDYKPLVSVIVPVYNGAKHLRRCIDTLLGQTLQSFELIFIDDGSTDNSLDILREYATRDRRFVILSQQNLQAGIARNTGMSAAHGEYFLFLDCDDWFERTMLEQMYNKISQDSSDVLVCGSWVYDDSKSCDLYPITIAPQYVQASPFAPAQFADTLFTFTNPNAWTKMFRADFIRQSGILFEDLSSCNDVTFTYTALARAGRISALDSGFVHYRTNSGVNISANRGSKAVNLIHAMQRLRDNLTAAGLFDTYRTTFIRKLELCAQYELDFCNDAESQDAFWLLYSETFADLVNVGPLRKLKEINKKIVVKNADGESDTTATVIIENDIDYTPLVSVIMPVYNGKLYLRKCMNSVLNQTLRDIEIICVDDGSTDGSLDLLKEYAARDNRITIISQKNLHAGVARNAGITVAKGQYLSFLDCDDWFAPDMLEQTYNTAQENDTNLVVYQYHYYNNIQHNTEGVRGIFVSQDHGDTLVLNPRQHPKDLFTLCNPMPWNKLFNRDFILRENLRFQSLTASNDVYFSLCSMACADKIVFMFKPFVYYRYNRQGSLKNTRDKNPFNFYEAYTAVHRTLLAKGLYDTYKPAFLTSFASTAMWTVLNTDVAKPDVRKLIRDSIIPNYISGNEKLLPRKVLNRLKFRANNELVVSLTSWPARIDTIHITIQSILDQTFRADRVILWLAPEQFPNKEQDLPPQLLALTNHGLTIDWYHDIRSYKKLIPTLRKYPDAVIVTTDDDTIYQSTWLETLCASYQKYPNDISAHRVTKFYYDESGFNTISGGLEYYKNASVLNKLVGCAGVLYPPHCFHDDILNEELIMRLAPTNDDQWFWIMAVLNGRKVRVVKNAQLELNYVPGTQDSALCLINDSGPNLFWKQFYNLMNYYPAARRMLLAAAAENVPEPRINKHRFNLENWYYRNQGKRLNLDNPRTFNEKIQWMKLHDSTPIKTRLADKYLVRDWVAERIGEQYLIPLLGVYDRFEDIDFEKLPNQFVIKCNHGCAYNIIVTDKSKLDMADTKAKLDKWMGENYAAKGGQELHYRDIPPKIVIEQFIENKKSGGDLYDYKLWCFNGRVEYIQFISERASGEKKMAFYDRDWNKQTFITNDVLDDKDMPRPDNLDEMISRAEALAHDFNYVRVDFYRLDDGQLYFGEMTFTPANGGCRWNDEKMNRYFGDLIKLPARRYNIDSGEYWTPARVGGWRSYLMFPVYLYQNRKLRREIKRLA